MRATDRLRENSRANGTERNGTPRQGERRRGESASKGNFRRIPRAGMEERRRAEGKERREWRIVGRAPWIKA